MQVLCAAHDDLGHNGFPRAYTALKRVFYWKGMKENIRDHCKMCATCILHRSENIKFERKVFQPSLLLMDFICMDLIGEFHPTTNCGHHYALTAVCMLKGFTWCIPLKSKKSDEVVKAYLDHIYSLFEGSVKILMDNGTEFKNQLFKEVVSKLLMEFSIHSPPYCYIVGLGLDCKFIDLLIKRSINIFIKISLYLNFIVLEIISKQTDTLI